MKQVVSLVVNEAKHTFMLAFNHFDARHVLVLLAKRGIIVSYVQLRISMKMVCINQDTSRSSKVKVGRDVINPI